MGSLFFLMFMAILFFVALFFIILNAIFIIIWNVHKRKEKSPKKKWLVIPIIFLIINIIVSLVPISYIGFLRYTNNKNEEKIIYAKSGIILYWPMGKYEPTTNWFEMNGKKYVAFRKGFSNENFYLDYTSEKLDTPVANIKYHKSSSSKLNNFMWTLLSGKTFSEQNQNISTVFPVENENNFEFFYVKNKPGRSSLADGTYCAEDTLTSTKAYYKNIANYDTQNLLCSYFVYTEEKNLGERNNKPYKKIEKNIILNKGIFMEIQKMYDSKQLLDVKIPQKYKDDDEKAVPGTPIFGYKEKILYAYSKDKMAHMQVTLVLINDRVYAEHSTKYDAISGYPLPDKMNEYIINTVFTD
ncbi:hypothetical protein [Clostridium sp. BJN0001]|uniref:hypothetical protein n=1 Tax=Clostridium sp. BJN0001 TaxID=2930219 RepID=UPI001FD336D7|nr:hypothetical protein [Clostridium sp. BJN0001]